VAETSAAGTEFGWGISEVLIIALPTVMNSTGGSELAKSAPRQLQCLPQPPKTPVMGVGQYCTEFDRQTVLTKTAPHARSPCFSLRSLYANYGQIIKNKVFRIYLLDEIC
jgi:hypothetical protein